MVNVSDSRNWSRLDDAVDVARALVSWISDNCVFLMSKWVKSEVRSRAVDAIPGNDFRLHSRCLRRSIFRLFVLFFPKLFAPKYLTVHSCLKHQNHSSSTAPLVFLSRM